jgi:Eukaryotic-type carbonic anhydrase
LVDVARVRDGAFILFSHPFVGGAIQPGSLPLIDAGIKKIIEPNKLRIDLYRRSCLVFTEDGLSSDNCRPRPPLADFPNYSSTVTQQSDLLHLDIKVPGEHTVRGEKFDAEIQMMHIHLEASRIAYIGIPIRATNDGYNEKYQALLDQFQIVYDSHKAECAAKQRRRGLRSVPKGFLGNIDRQQSSYSDDPAFKRRMEEIWSSKLPFHPHADFLETFFFYRYNGSSPDPPCFPVTWFVMEQPIHINFQQLKQTKVLLFTHVNGDCEKTSVHNADQSVVRPIQPLGVVFGTKEKREIMACMPGDFPPDDPTVPVQN